MDQPKEFFFPNKKEWRDWLSENHSQKEAVWLIFFKKSTAKLTMCYDDAVEQALCFGWIDGTVKSIDEEKYMRKLMPRTNFYNWSPSNRIRVEKLIKSGEMTKIGLTKIGDYQQTGKILWPLDKSPVFVAFTKKLFEILCANENAIQFFNSLSSSHQQHYIQWVMQANREETRISRMHQAIDLLNEKVKNLLK